MSSLEQLIQLSLIWSGQNESTCMPIGFRAPNWAPYLKWLWTLAIHTISTHPLYATPAPCVISYFTALFFMYHWFCYAYLLISHFSFVTCILGNNEAYCRPQESHFPLTVSPLTNIDEALHLMLTYIASFIVASCALALAIIACEKYLDCHALRTLIDLQWLTDRDQKHVLENRGEIVYWFFYEQAKVVCSL